jgi:hemin uptake protein HemP|tara:strand:- start:378 stop:587 length:210 start_codon:yes stop_codon:yes gene_type:complete
MVPNPFYRTGEKLMLERNILRDVAQPVIKKLPTYQAEDLTQGGQEAQIVLSEQIYNLRITRSGKLILTK